MLSRRTAIALGAALSTGCLRFESAANAEDNAGLATLSVERIDVPDAVEMFEEYDVVVAVGNEGDEARTFRGALQANAEGTDWYEIGDIELSVDAGETREWSETYWHEGIESVRFRVADTDQEATMEVTPAEHDVGELLLLRGVDFSFGVTDATLATSVPYETADGEEREATPSEGRQFLLSELRAENEGEEPLPLPNPDNISAVVDDEAFGTLADLNGVVPEQVVGPYEGPPLRSTDRVDPGDDARAWFACSIPESAAPDEVNVEWRRPIEERGDQVAVWSLSG